MKHKSAYQNLLIVLFALVFNQIVCFKVEAQDIDALLKKAETVYEKDPFKGIFLARQTLQTAKDEKKIPEAIKCLKQITFFYWDIQDFNSAKLYAEEGFSLSKMGKIDTLAGDFLVLKGAIEYIKNNYESALTCYQQAIPYYSKDKQTRRIGNAYVNIGLCEMKLSRFATANSYFFKSAEIFQKLKDTADLSASYNSMGVCFLSLNEPEKALQYHKKALAITVKLKDKTLIGQSLNNIGLTFKKFKQLDSALLYLKQSLDIAKQEKDSSLMVLPLQNIGVTLKQKGNLAAAENYLLHALNIAQNYEMKEEIAGGKLDLAELYIVQKKYSKAVKAISDAEKNAIGLKTPELLMDTYNAYYNLYKAQGSYKQALFYSLQKTTMSDSLFSIAKSKTISELEIKYQTTQKEKDIAALNAQNNLQKKIVKQQKLSIVILTVSALLMLLLFAFAYHNYRVKTKANERIKTLMHDLHHRVKNNLQILAGLFSMQINEFNDENTKNTLRENETRLVSMNLIHNKLYHSHTTDTKIEMKEYLSNLLTHIKVSFGGEKDRLVHLNLSIDELYLEADIAVAIGLIVNELVTNSFKYAFDETGGEIYLSLKQQAKSKLLLHLKDNGKGITNIDNRSGQSFGLKLVGLMARQLKSSLVTKNEQGTSHQMEISI